MLMLLMAVLALYLASIVLYAVIVFKEGSIGDQVLAIDAITYASVVLIVLFSLIFKEPILVVVAIPLALWIYALDIYVAKYLEKGDLSV